MNKITSVEMRRIARVDIAQRLKMSLPTITQNLKDLEDKRLITRGGVFQSTGGRKPRVITCVGDVRIAVGVEISSRQIDLAAVDIYGEVIEKRKFSLKYEDSERYHREFARRVMSLCAAASTPAPTARRAIFLSAPAWSTVPASRAARRCRLLSSSSAR